MKNYPICSRCGFLVGIIIFMEVETVFATYAKYFFIIICSFYFYYKLLHLSIAKKEIITIILFSIFIQIPLFYIHEYAPFIFVPFMVIVFYILVLYISKATYNVSFVTSVISFGLTYFTFFWATIILLLPGLFLLGLITNRELFNIITHLLIGMVQLLISSLPFRLRRLKKGMPFIMQKTSNTVGIIISIFILLAISLLGIRENNDFILASYILFTAICGLLLIVWWRRQITKSYLEKLRTKEMMDLRNDFAALKKENEKLSKIIHKDNKLIPAMEMAVKDLLSTYTSNDSNAELAKKASSLLSELERLSSERNGILQHYETTAAILPTTGLVRIDSLLSYMQQKATSCGINFNFSLNCNLKFMTNNIIDENSLSTIIADLVENSIISSKNQTTKSILLSINIENTYYCLNVFDSGTPFEPHVIMNLGKVRTTTHADTGGSGIGLMTLFEILEQCKASFTLDETLNNNLYTKKISLCFDGLNQINIKSNRVSLHSIASIRDDIIFG